MNEKYKYWNYAQKRLPELGVRDTSVMNRYNEGHRFYHTWPHIEDLLSQFNKRNLLENDTLFLATIFHDAIYNPKASDNEEKSVALFHEMYHGSDAQLKDEVARIIIDTKTHKPSSRLSKIFCERDMDILNSPFSKLIEYENQIFKEYQFADWKDYKHERVKVLRSLQRGSELEPLISYIESRKPNIGLYCGSFNPFTTGHYNILQKAERIFDKVIIARGINPEKSNALIDLPDKIKFRQIETYNGLLTDFIKGLSYDVTLIRGLRNATDFQYEATQYKFLQDLMPEIKVVSLFCDSEFEHVSSSAVRQLEKYGQHKKYLP